MKIKNHIFEKCCFYYPLGTGLLIWGYFNLMRDCTLDGISATTCANRLRLHFAYGNNDPFYEDRISIAIMFVLTITMVLVNLVFNLIYIVAMHRKQTGRLKACMIFFSIKLFLYTTILVAGNIGGNVDVRLYEWMYRHVDPVTFYLAIEYTALGVIDIVFKLHHIILIRSHLINEGAYDETRTIRF